MFACCSSEGDDTLKNCLAKSDIDAASCCFNLSLKVALSAFNTDDLEEWDIVVVSSGDSIIVL